MIERSGQWWTGTEFEDLAANLREFTAEGYPAEKVVQSTWSAGAPSSRIGLTTMKAAHAAPVRHAVTSRYEEWTFGDDGLVVELRGNYDQDEYDRQLARRA